MHRKFRYRQISSTSSDSSDESDSSLIRIPDSPVIIKKQRKRKAAGTLLLHSTPSPSQKKPRRYSIRKSKVLKRKKMDFEADYAPPVKAVRQCNTSLEVSNTEPGNMYQDEPEEFKINVANDEGLDGRPWSGDGESEQAKIHRQKCEYWDRLTLEAFNFHDRNKVSGSLESDSGGSRTSDVSMIEELSAEDFTLLKM